jgi:hypothetical protein
MLNTFKAKVLGWKWIRVFLLVFVVRIIDCKDEELVMEQL